MDRISLGIGLLLLLLGVFALVNSFVQLTGGSLGLVASNIGAFSFLAIQGALLFVGGLAITIIATTGSSGNSAI